MNNSDNFVPLISLEYSIKALRSLQCFISMLSLLLIIDIYPHMDLLHTSIFYPCLADYLLSLVMYLSFQILSLLLWMMRNMRPIRIMFSFIFNSIFIKTYHLQYTLSCYFCCKYSHQSLVTQLSYLYYHLLILLHSFPPKSCDTIIFFVLSL